ncbi:MAG: Smr/MutS family protein [Flavobacteriales bacterium]|nr:Smr/MutS family protein [Flavobacteriales bacterium]MBK7553472.1 Smr/MutS family protein [Flavobacteriales bacterium]MBK9195414.1 Smr/MutS family protein [Flavobacteriales bacterium]
MSSKFRPGDKFIFLDEPGGGTVIELLSHNRAKVKTHDGFELEYALSALVPMKASADRYIVSDHQAQLIAANDRMEEEKKRQARKGAALRPGKTAPRPEDNSVAEVDLHLHELVEDETVISQDEKLRYQLAYFERSLEAAIRNGKRKLIVIHGVGEGILREEVRRTLQFYESVRFEDADPRRYGSGATEVTILRH